MTTNLITENNLIAEAIFTDQILVIAEGEDAGDIEAKVSEVMNIQGANQVQLLVEFTAGESDGVHLKIEFSEDQESWYQESMVSEFPTTGIVSHVAVLRKIVDTCTIVISIPVSGSYIRVIALVLTDGEDAKISITATAASI